MAKINLRNALFERDCELDQVDEYLEGALEADDAFASFSEAEEIEIEETDIEKYFEDYRLWVTFK